MEVLKDLQLQIALHNDIRAYRQLYLLLSDRLQHFSFSITKSREGAEEIVSDAFIKIWQKRSQLHGIDNLKAYLYTTTRNLSLNYIAKQSKSPVRVLNEVPAETIIELNSPEEMLIAKETFISIEQVVHRLPAQCKAVFQLVKEEGLKYKEVASELNISVFTVRNQMSIATKKIGKALFVVVQEPFAQAVSN
ncbi:RNA polymerase sigma-70 factor [Lacibacter luteus]|uniref:RNA polymerase sigma-70 factor n=1 Tax=Lacibacter luteus TaxID=2508719 RepID=A0A4Q1CLJ9_9BACT|nr:RNA polymerase sigma-70 factor [Lacibacter luteus]RXK61575.1 RNA polymerase sigma-70 factor [Lacibacter luteus]